MNFVKGFQRFAMPDLNKLVNQPVTHVWLSDHSVLYLEVGNLSPGRLRKNGTLGNPKGDFTIFLGGDWRLERPRSILGGRNLSSVQRERLVQKLQGSIIRSIVTHGRIPELSIEFSSGYWLTTFELDGTQPWWSIGFNSTNEGYLCVKRGKLFVEQPRPSQETPSN